MELQDWNHLKVCIFQDNYYCKFRYERYKELSCDTEEYPDIADWAEPGLFIFSLMACRTH